MQLSAMQRKLLELYKQYRQSPPTARDLFVELMVKTSLFFMLVGAGVAVIATSGSYVLAAFFAGILVGVVVAAIGRNTSTVHLWPLLEAILDWNKVDAMLDNSDQRSDPTTI